MTAQRKAVREIAHEAGVSMGKLYLYPTKEDIFIGLVRHMEQKMEVLRRERFFRLPEG